MARPIPNTERASYSRLWQRFAAHLKELLKAKHGGEVRVAQSAHELGIHKVTLENVLYTGLMPSVELCERLVRYLGEGVKYTKAPKIRALTQAQSRKGWVKVDVWIPQSLADEYARLSLKWGLSEMALRSLALSRFAAHEPPWHAVKQVVREVESALEANYLDAHPEMNWVLDMEPAWVAAVAKKPAKEYRDPGLPLPHEELLRLGREQEFPPDEELTEEL